MLAPTVGGWQLIVTGVRIFSKTAPVGDTKNSIGPVGGDPLGQARELSMNRPIGGQVRAKRRLGTVSRLIIGLVLVTAAVLGLVVEQVVNTFDQHSTALTRQVLADEVTEFDHALSLYPATASVFQNSSRYLSTHQVDSLRVLVIALRGNPILGSTGSQKILASAQIASWVSKPPPSTLVRQISVASSPYLVLVSPIRQGVHVIGVFVVASDLSAEYQQSRQVLFLALLEAGVALAFTVGSGYLLLRRVMATVGGITSAATGIADGDLSRRIDYRGADDEVGTLARTFDNMIDRLDETMMAQRRLLADVSHQLKTPLTIIRGNLELIGRSGEPLGLENTESLAFAIEEISYMNKLIDELMMLGRTMEKDFLSPELVDLRAFMADIYSAASVMAQRKWSYVEPPDFVVNIDSAKLRGAILNLVENAVKATQVGDEIVLGGWADASILTISVADNGPGVPKGLEEQIFRRFQRGDAAYQKGAGLGLSIVDAVAKAHNGCVVLAKPPLGGAEFSILLPLSIAVHYHD